MLAAHVNSQLLLGYDAYMPRDIMVMTVRLAILVSVLLTVPLIHFPVRRLLNNIVFTPEREEFAFPPFRFITILTNSAGKASVIKYLVLFFDAF